jgi:hypothetical protein
LGIPLLRRFAMFVAAKKTWIKRVGLAAVAAVAIGAAVLPSKPAQAQVVVGVGPYYAPGYYQPYYYPRRVAYRSCGWGWHWVPPHWTRWGRWVPGGCRPSW